MIRPIIKDINFLKLKSTPANASDKHIADDLIDTLSAHREECVGMAANMIGENKKHNHCKHGLYATCNV